MGPLSHRLLRPQVLLALCISLALILSPAAVQAAPAASSLAQTAYDDPDGRFSLTVPDAFTEQADITYEMLGDNPLDKLVASAGRAFGEADTPNGVSVLFLLLDEAIEDRAEFAGFLAAFQTAAGGETLPLVDLDFVDSDRLAAAGSAATRDRQLQIAIEAQDNVVAILTTSVERARYSDLRSALADTLAGFTWQPDAVLASLGGDVAPPPEEAEPEAEPTPEPEAEPEIQPTPEPEAEPEAEPAPADDTPQRDPDAALETERYTDADRIFTIAAPAGMTTDDARSAEDALYGTLFYGPEDSDNPTLGVAFVPAAFAASDSQGVPDFSELDDELWNQFVDTFVVADFGEDATIITDQRNDALRTAFLVLEANDPAPDQPEEAWIWVEESDGMGALFLVFGDLDDPMNGEIFHRALTSFAWSPSAAATATAELAGVFDPAQAPVSFDDPFGLITAYTPPAYPFQAAYYKADTLEYKFGRNPVDGVFQISLSSPSESAYNPSSWGILVDETQKSVLQTLSDGGLGANGRLIQQDVGVPDVGADNAATILARTDAYWMLVTLLDRDGVLMSDVVILPDSYWQDYAAVVEDAVSRGVDFDPDAVRDAIDFSQELGVAVVETGAAGAVPARGEEIEWRSSFDPDDSITVAVDFAQPAMEGALKALLFADDQPDYPVAQFAQWLGEEDAFSYGKMTSQEETGTRAAFFFVPDFPLNSGEYTAHFYYDNELVAANGFTVEDSPPAAADGSPSVDIANFGPAYGDGAAGEPLLVTTAIHPGDVVSLRGQVDMPAGSQLRLFWYDPEGWVDTGEVATIRFDSSYHIPYDWVYFDPQIAWQPGWYGYLLTVDGEPFYEGMLFIVEESAEVELTPDGAELLAALPVPEELILDASPDEYDLAILPTEDLSSIDLVSLVDAWLRMQGWEPSLPPVSSPIAWDFRRWVKDGYQFVLEPGGFAAEDQLWMNYAPVTDTTWGPTPAGEALDAVNVDALGEAAALEIEGLDASQAAVSPDGNWLAVTTTDGTLYVFDAVRLMDTIWWQPDAFYANPVFSPDGRDLAVTVQRQSRSEIQLFSNFDVIWLPTTRLNGHADQITAIDYQSDGWLASGGLDGAVRQWEPRGEFLPVLADGEGAVTGLAAAPESAPGVIVAREGGWLEYRLDDGDVPWADVVALTEAPQVAVWPDFNEIGGGDLAVYGEGPVEWFLYDTEEIGLGLDVPEENPDFASTGAAFSPNGALLVIGGDTIHFYDRTADIGLSEWEVVASGERSPVVDLSVSPDGRYVVIVAEDGSVRLWAATVQ